MGFSLSGRTEARTTDIHGKFMDAATIWDFPGKNWQASPRHKLKVIEKGQFDGPGTASYHQVLAYERSQTWRNGQGTF
jgi:hypothetical protein